MTSSTIDGIFAQCGGNDKTQFRGLGIGTLTPAYDPPGAYDCSDLEALVNNFCNLPQICGNNNYASCAPLVGCLNEYAIQAIDYDDDRGYISAHVFNVESTLCGELGRNITFSVGTISVQYVGHAFGRGRLEVAPGSEAPTVRGRMILHGEGESEPHFELEGIGTCRNGVVRLRFNSADHPAAPVRILGGRLVALRDSELLERTFGMWTAQVVEKKDGKTRELHGYLRELATADAAASPVTSSAPLSGVNPDNGGDRPPRINL